METSATPAAPDDARPAGERHSSRRALLKLGGAAAAAGVAAAVAGASELAHPGTAHAHSDTVTFQQSASGLNNVAIEGDGTNLATGVYGTSDTGIGVYATSSSGTGVYATSSSGTGVAGGSVSGTGVLGSGATAGVYGASDATPGVWGSSTSGDGVFGASNSGHGVSGTSSTNNGVYGRSTSLDGVFGGGGRYGGLFHGLLAPILLYPSGSSGAPSGGTHIAGELYVDGAGVFWACTASGTPGTWIRLSGPQTGTQGGAIHYLSSPIRLLAALNGASGSLVNRSALGPLEIFALPVAGLSGSGIPASAQGLIANVTVLGPSNGGNLSLFPAGASIPTVASMTFGQGMYLANGVNVAIGTGGQVNIQNQSSGTTPLVVDAVAYVA
jgi:hypothetical protein